jgi:hypothetical protein
MAVSLRGAPVSPEVITAVRALVWYVAYPFSYRQVKALMREPGGLCRRPGIRMIMCITNSVGYLGKNHFADVKVVQVLLNLNRYQF